jgi:micrococcal nuclease
MRVWLCVLFLFLTSCSIVTRSGGRRSATDDIHDAQGFILLNGERTAVHWSDGDSFTLQSGPWSGQGTRLVGYNTLESFGPVHRWGSWTREELYTLTKGDAKVCAAKEWECTSDGSPDAYQRILVNCPTLALEMVRLGRGLAYAVRGKPERIVLDAMHQAQRAKKGFWAKGVPSGIITALHSFEESEERRKVNPSEFQGDPEDAPEVKYTTSSNRILDTYTGEAWLQKHTDKYDECQEVCIPIKGSFSCMVNVSFERRYKDQPPCLVGE